MPLPGLVIDLLTEHQRHYPPGLVFTSRSGAAVRRTTFRATVWRPSPVRAGLPGKIVEVGERRSWRTSTTAKAASAPSSSPPSGKRRTSLLQLKAAKQVPRSLWEAMTN